MGNRSHARKLALAAIAGILLAASAHAANDFDQSQLKAFAKARTQIQKIQQKYSSRMQSADGDDETAKLQSEAQRKMAAAVDDAGLSVDEYNQIGAAARKDEELQQKIKQLSQ